MPFSSPGSTEISWSWSIKRVKLPDCCLDPVTGVIHFMPAVFIVRIMPDIPQAALHVHTYKGHRDRMQTIQSTSGRKR